MTDSTGDNFGHDYFSTTYDVDGLKRFSQAWWSARLYAGLARGCLRRSGGTRLLEVGCGLGFFLSQVENEYETVGLDVSDYAVERCGDIAPKSKCYVSNVEQDLPEELAPRSFDLVLAKYVFEHLHDPQAAMARVVGLLRLGGILIFAVPNTESFGARQKGQDWYAHKDPTHCSLFTPSQWLELTRRSGATLLRETSDGYWDLPYYEGVPMFLQKLMFLPTCALACLVARPILPPRFGENVIVIARKDTAPSPVPSSSEGSSA